MTSHESASELMRGIRQLTLLMFAAIVFAVTIVVVLYEVSV